MRFQILAVLLFVVGASAVELHIIKGKDSNAHSKPWLLTVWRNGNGYPRTRRISDCGASLLRLSPYQKSSDIALTAAHCIGKGHSFMGGDARNSQPCHDKKKLFQEHSVVISNHNLEKKDKNEKEIKVIDGQCHKGWNPEDKNYKDDIALLKLAESVPFSDTVQGIDLAELGEELAPGTICNAAGWGASGYFNNHPLRPIAPKVLQEIDVEVANFTIVQKYYPRFVDFKQMIVTTPKNGEGGECEGDSGGPLVCQKNGKSVQYGVLSNGDICHKFAKPFFAFYSSISSYRNWINQEIAKLQQKIL